VQASERMRWLVKSPMYRVPEGLTVTPKGFLKREAVPKPFKKVALEPPATVVTMPRGVIMRIRLLLESATRRLPLAAKERWRGKKNAAEVPVPSTHVPLPLPAKVDTAPLARMSLMRLFSVSPT